MKTPETTDQLDLILEHGLELSEEVRDMIKLFALQEFRRGYLHGQRDMKMSAENAIAGLRVEEA
jgi:hypothetical protein